VRITGLLCIITMPIIIYYLAKEISDRADIFKTVLIACALFLTNPAVIQGSLIIDQADPTLLLPVLCLFYIALFKTEKHPLWHRALVLGVAFALCMWTKITTPLACTIALPLTFFLQKEIKKGIILSLSVFVTGGVIFLCTWFFYCQLLAGSHRFFEPFVYYAGQAKTTVFVFSSSTIGRIITDIFRVTIWFSPLFLLLAGLTIPNTLKEADHSKPSKNALFLALFAGVVFLTYGYACATFSSFPKYFLPALPMVCCLIAAGTSKRLNRYNDKNIYILGIISICCGVVYYYFYVGDVIYTIHLFRQAQLIGGTKEVFSHLLRQQTLSFLFPAVLFIVSMRIVKIKLFDRIILVLLIALISNNLSLSLTQRQASYTTNYAYGTEGAEQLREFLRTGKVHDVYTSIEGYMANINSVTFHNPANKIWATPDNFLAFLKQDKPSCFIYGLASNSADELARVMQNTNVILRLRADYQEVVFGSYHVLLRNKDYGRLPPRATAGYINYGYILRGHR